MAKLFPIFLNLKGKEVLIVGGGNVALEKLNSLLPCKPKITIISKSFNSEILKIKQNESGIRIIVREIQSDDLEGKFMIFLATNDKNLNSKICESARNKKIIINSVDDKSSSDFYSAAVFDRGPFRIAVSTEGKFAGFAKMLKNALVEILPEENENEWRKLTGMRKTIINKIPNSIERKKTIRKIITNLEEEYFALKGKK